MKKLLLLVPSLQQGGFQRVCARTAELMKETCEVTILIFNGDDIFYQVDGVEIIDINVKSREKRWQKLINVARRMHKVRRIRNQKQISVSYSFGSTANIVNVLSGGAGKVWAGYRGFDDMYSSTHAMVCRRADKVICCSRMMQQLIRRQFPDADAVSIYNPFNVEEIREQAKESIQDWPEELTEGTPLIMSMGREDDLKGYWHLLKSFSLFAGKLPEARLMLVGAGEFTEYKRLAEELGIRDKVYFTGARKNPFPYLRRADVYVLSSRREGFPNALVEAMLLGVPVIAANCKSGPGEILFEDYRKAADRTRVYHADYGILVKDMDFEKDMDAGHIIEEDRLLADQIELLLTDRELYEYYREQGRKRAEIFTPEAYAVEMMKNM